MKNSRTTKAADNRVAPYDPARLLDALIEALQLKNDAALALALEIAPPVISKIRHGKQPIGPSMLLRMHLVSELTVCELYGLMCGATTPVSRKHVLQAMRKASR